MFIYKFLSELAFKVPKDDHKGNRFDFKKAF